LVSENPEKSNDLLHKLTYYVQEKSTGLKQPYGHYATYYHPNFKSTAQEISGLSKAVRMIEFWYTNPVCSRVYTSY